MPTLARHQHRRRTFRSMATFQGRLDLRMVEPTIFFRGGPNEAVGCILRGDLVVTLSRPMKVKKIEMTFVGKARTYVPEGYNAVSDRSCRCEDEIIRHTWEFVAPLPSTKDNSSTASPGLLRHGNNKPKSPSHLLPAGKHAYPFELLLPGNLPETVEAEHHSVVYKLVAKVTRSGFYPSLKLRRYIDIVRTVPCHMIEQGIHTAREVEDLFGYEISIPKLAYPIAQRIPIDVKINPHCKNFKVVGVRVDMVEKSVYRVNGQKFSRARNVCSTSADVKKVLMGPDEEEGDVGNVFFQQSLDLRLPNCSSSIVQDCDVQGLTVTHQLQFLFTVTAPTRDTRRVQVKVNLGVRLLSCRCVDDFVSLPNYDEDSYYCPCDPVHQRLARLVLGDAVVDHLKPPPDYEGVIAADSAANSVRSASPMPKVISVDDESILDSETATI